MCKMGGVTLYMKQQLNQVTNKYDMILLLLVLLLILKRIHKE